MKKNEPVSPSENSRRFTGDEAIDSLVELALNMRSSWNHATDTVWRTLDPHLWEITQNPGWCCRRFRATRLSAFIDFFVSSSFVHVRKPDADIFRFALDIAQVPARQVIYSENTPLFVEIAEDLRIQSILHTDFQSTSARLALLGLSDTEEIS